MTKREKTALAEAIEHCAMHIGDKDKLAEWQNVLGEAGDDEAAEVTDPLAELRHQLRQAATALARNRDTRAVMFVDALMRLDFGRISMPAGLESGAAIRGE